jgi:Uma2 family endonuclease
MATGTDMTAAPRLRFSFAEYLLVDEASEARHEYLDGLILGMAGGTPEHARIAAAVVASLARQLEGKRCAVFSEALRIRVAATGFAGYPDVTVVCGALEHDPQNHSTITNPAVLVEVLSPSTADYDRSEKLQQYQQIPSVRHIVLVAHEGPRVDVWTRTGGAGFACETFGAGGVATLPAIACSLDVDAIFRDPLAG